MNVKKIVYKSLPLILLFQIGSIAQTRQETRVSTVVAVLTKAIETKSADVGTELTMRTINDVVVDGTVVIPKGSKLVGHISEIVIKGKDEPQTKFEIVIDKAVTTNNNEMPVQAIVAAVAAPKKDSLSSDPTYGMMRSNEPKQSGASPGDAARTGELSSASKAGSTAAVATANLKGASDEPLMLREDSQGAIGYDGLSLSWHLTTPPPVTVFSSKSKNVKLDEGTQMLLRMSAPHAAR
ncbi:MAG TPA: hypothetical protein VKB86_13805 [Pyrinomonadaceae bacterium]|nr:hypothetical protein [Pyrinomonadaceae bacterium]